MPMPNWFDSSGAWHDGQELINVFGLATRFGITASQIRDNICAYPTFASDIKHMPGHA
jgi:glutathione reductase (NADPH)